MALILAISVALAADGRVRVQGSGDPIADALVRATDGSVSTTTDEKGRFRIDLPAGATVVVLADGYAP
ncbi:MAG TPA: carboxypeptidase regulatory-like domain-containing protein, partial [Myxococcota bacterium]|nr:carboxypeptidase regulatory-like domain-containing protein [Myxococcota bacterium]